MPIIHLGNPSTDRSKPNFTGYHYAAGYKRYDSETNDYVECPGPSVYWTYESHHGLCLEDREINGYDDSDWYMIVWNPEKGEPERIFFASTRGWSYPCYASSPCATPEVRAEYQAWEEARARRARIMGERARRNAKWEDLRKMRITLKQYNRIVELYWKKEQRDRIFAVLRIQKPRSEFKISLINQIRSWLEDENPKYKYPLTIKQLECL